jgi:drug/metabolite transporter (DMT)-like permease
MTQDRPLLGILLMLGFCIAIPFADACAKLIGTRLPLVELVLVRFAGQALLLAPLAWLAGQSLRLGGRVLGLTALRSLLQIAGITLMYLSLRYLPLADAVAIAFVMPFLILLLAWAFAGETVGPHRLGACIVGFAGTILVIQPNFAAVGAPALLPLGVAVVFAVFMLVTRAVAKATGPLALQAVTGGLSVAVLLPGVLLAVALGHTGAVLRWPEGWDGALLATLTVVGTFAHLLMSWALRFAPSSTLAPMQYLEIPMAALVGLAVFGDLPNGLALAGILVTICAGLYIVWRERLTARQAPSSLPPMPPPAG